jgi:hypothetical protein
MLGDDFPFKIDALFQFIGDLQRDEVRVRLVWASEAAVCGSTTPK